MPTRVLHLAALVMPLLLAGGASQAQAVARPVVVEHFTNSRCSICAGRNPGFYATLRQQPGVLHLAYYPSAPYAACVFSQQNPTENDARTRAYGVYGSTPRLVINGTVIPAAQNYADPALYAPFQGQTSPLAVSATLQAQGADSLTVTVVIETRAAPVPANLTLYVPLVQDTVTYAAPNGEPLHFDVFRKSFTGVAPLAIAPAAVGGTLTVRRTVYRNPLWEAPRLYAAALVQEAGGALVQAAVSPHFTDRVSGLPPAAEAATLRAYPNPVGAVLRLAPAAGEVVQAVTICNALGRVVYEQRSDAPGLTEVAVADLPPGLYVLRARTAAGRRHTVRFVKA